MSVDDLVGSGQLAADPHNAVDPQTLLEAELYQQSIEHAKPDDLLSAARSVVVKFPAVAVGVGFVTGGMLGWLTSKKK